MLLGDLNLTPWSTWSLKLQAGSGLVRDIVDFTIETTLYRFPMFPFGVILDHCLIEPTLGYTDIHVGQPMGSDHRSITLRLASEGKRQAGVQILVECLVFQHPGPHANLGASQRVF